MSDNDLYVKQKNGRYKKWGKIYDIFTSVLPYGIWVVDKNSKCNIEDRLIAKEDIKSIPLVSTRLSVKNKISKFLLKISNEDKNYSIDEISFELAKILVPNKNKLETRENTKLNLRGKKSKNNH